MINVRPGEGRFSRENSIQSDMKYPGTATSERVSLPLEEAVRVGPTGDEASRPGFIRNGRGTDDDDAGTVVTKLATAGIRGLLGE